MKPLRTKELEIIVSLEVDADEPIVEFWDESKIPSRDMMMADVTPVDGKLELRIYPRRDDQPWVIPVKVLVDALEVARETLAIKSPGSFDE